MIKGHIHRIVPGDDRLLKDIADMDAEIFPGNVWGLGSYAKSAGNDYDCVLAFVINDECDTEGEAAADATEAQPAADGLLQAKEHTDDANAHAAGFALLRCFDDAELIRIAASPQYRREGIGRRLLDALIGEAGKRGVGRIFLEVRCGNTAAIKLYEGAGFERTGVRKDYYHEPKEDALIMRYTC